MKKLFTFFILTTTLLSCSSNESDITFITNNDIIGNWRLVHFKIEGITKGMYKNSNVNGMVILLLLLPLLQMAFLKLLRVILKLLMVFTIKQTG